MLTQTFQVFNLRGIDQRWITDPYNALHIQDMTWNSSDSWSTSGGWRPFFRFSPYYVGNYGTGGVSASSYDPVTGSYRDDGSTYEITRLHFPHVRSIHWFAQHNGARQFLVYEQQTWDVDKRSISEDLLELRYFDGSRAYWDASNSGNKEPSRVMVEFKRDNRSTAGDADVGEGLKAIDNRFDPGLCVPTQYQSWGNRLYIVNGYQRPIVFNGEYVENAGFNLEPDAPSAHACHWLDTATFPTAIGIPKDEYFEGGVFPLILAGVTHESSCWLGRFEDFRYHGMGPGSFAKYKTGKYRPHYLEIMNWAEGDADSGTTITAEALAAGVEESDDGTSYDDNLALRFALRFNKQFDRRRVGWKYKVTFVNERGHESEPSKASPLCKTFNGTGEPNHHGSTMLTVEIPRGPSECVARRIYRTRNLYNPKGKHVGRGKGERYYFLKEIPDNMTKRWVDSHPDASLGSLLKTRKFGYFPQNARFIASFKNTMFVCGDTDNKIRYSAPNFPETFPKRNKIHISDGDGGPVTGIRATKNALVVFKTRGIYLIKGDPRKGFFAQTLTQDIGMCAPNSLAELPGVGLAFLSEKGIYLLEGALENTGTITNVVKLSTEIPDHIEKINSSAAIRSVGLVNEEDNEYWLAVPMDGSKVNNLVLVYHYLAGSWSTRKNFPISCATVSKDHRGYVFFGIEHEENVSKRYRGSELSSMGRSSIGTDRMSRTDLLPLMKTVGIGHYSKGYSMKGQTWDVEPIYKTPNQPFGTVFTSVQPAHVYVYAIGYGDNQMSLNYTVNRSVFEVRKNGQNVDQQDPNERYPVYGKAEWDKDYWGEYRPTVLRYDVSATHKGPAREFGVTFSKADDAPSGTKIEIIGYDIEAKVGEQRKIKPLNEALKPDRR